MATDPLASAVEAIAGALEEALGPDGAEVLSAVLRGWPESDMALDLSGAPVLSVTPGAPVREACAPFSLGSETDEETGIVTHTYRVGYLRFTAQLDLWAAYRAHLDDVGAAVEAACMQDPPLPPELRVTSTGYYDRPITCVLGAGRDDFDSDSANKGEWRKSWDLEVVTDVVRLTTHVPAARFDLEAEVGEGSNTITGTVSVPEE